MSDCTAGTGEGSAFYTAFDSRFSFIDDWDRVFSFLVSNFDEGSHNETERFFEDRFGSKRDYSKGGVEVLNRVVGLASIDILLVVADLPRGVGFPILNVLYAISIYILLGELMRLEDRPSKKGNSIFRGSSREV